MHETKIKAQLKELQNNLECLDISNEKVSKASIGWHVSHTTRIFSAICKNSIQSDPTEFKSSFNKNRFKIKVIGYIPRGLGRSPKAFLNLDNMDAEKLKSYLIKAESLFEDFSKVPKNHFIKHPIFGLLNKKETLWFLKVHNEHHLKIIRDIQK
jgi:hypothetical protein